MSNGLSKVGFWMARVAEGLPLFEPDCTFEALELGNCHRASEENSAGQCSATIRGLTYCEPG
jgi:hypothetical protein